jgi:endonuclease/exonuclease/phosphatase family metal-dependent hydrolase
VKAFTFGTYNLENGGLDGGRDDRLRRQLATLAAVNADAWAFQECKGWRTSGKQALFLAEGLLGMRGFLVPSSHHECDLAVFVREAAGIRAIAERHEQGAPYWHAVARVVVEVDGLADPLHLASAHLAPSSPTIRLAEGEALALLAKDGLVIAGGDWNAVPATDPEPDRDGIDPGHARRKLDRAAALAIEEAGFTDVGAYLCDFSPTVGHGSGLYYRCDRVYTTFPAEAITGHEVMAMDGADSDHYPAVARFNLAVVSRMKT